MTDHLDTLESVKLAFQHWRASRVGQREHTPASLRKRALTLQGKHTKQEICVALGINHRAFKSWADIPPETHDSFVTLPTEMITTDPTSEILVRLKAVNGSECELSGQLRISDLIQIMNTFTAGGVSCFT